MWLFLHLAFAERPDRDDEELVPLCVDRFAGLKDSFTLQGGASMKVSDIRSFSLGDLQDLVSREKGDWKLVPAWLDANNLRPLLRNYLDPAEVKKSKVASIPSGVFGEGQSNN